MTSRSKKRLAPWLGCLLTAAVLPACDAPGPTRDPFRSGGRPEFTGWSLRNVDLDTVRPIARRVFREYYRIDPTASGADRWVSFPVELTEDEGGERLTDALAVSPRRRREIAYLQVLQSGSHVLARCHVRKQRLETAERAAFARTRQFGGDDRPTETPIDRAGAGSTSNREEWVDIGRDRVAEREILERIESVLFVAEPAGPAVTRPSS